MIVLGYTDTTAIQHSHGVSDERNGRWLVSMRVIGRVSLIVSNLDDVLVDVPATHTAKHSGSDSQKSVGCGLILCLAVRYGLLCVSMSCVRGPCDRLEASPLESLRWRLLVFGASCKYGE